MHKGWIGWRVGVAVPGSAPAWLKGRSPAMPGHVAPGSVVLLMPARRTGVTG